MTARILVVDDIEANVKLLEAKLSAEYFDVLTATDGPTALALAAAEKPDIILLDVMMPGMDGFEVCRRLKDDPLTRHIPVVLVTALDGRADRIAGLEAGADEFITKPIDDLIMFSRVRNLTRLKLVIDELRDREASGRRIGVIAGAAARLAGVPADVIRRAVEKFQAVEHRLEYVTTRNGVEFYNDSKATNVDATAKAVAAFSGGIHLILGGKDKGSPYTVLADLLRERVSAVYTIGAAAAKIESQLRGVVTIQSCETLDKAVAAAAAAARPGEVVLLAPACSSYDQFENYEQRGTVFKQLVKELQD